MLPTIDDWSLRLTVTNNHRFYLCDTIVVKVNGDYLGDGLCCFCCCWRGGVNRPTADSGDSTTQSLNSLITYTAQFSTVTGSDGCLPHSKRQRSRSVDHAYAARRHQLARTAAVNKLRRSDPGEAAGRTLDAPSD